jgi:hypothetical protein
MLTGPPSGCETCLADQSLKRKRQCHIHGLLSPCIAWRYDKKLYYPLTSDPVLFIYRETKDSTTAESVVRQSY